MRYFKLFALLLLSSYLSAQELDNTIRIVGQASQTVEPIGIHVKFKIEEVERNEYQKIMARTLEDVRLDLTNHLESMGYSKANLEELLPNSGGYNSKINEIYQIKLKTLEDLKEFKQGNFTGFTITEVQYAYDSSIGIDDKKLAKEAIDDARRKAESLAKHIGKKVGEVRSVHDRSYSKLSVPATHRADKYTLKYEINISFDLLTK